MPVAFGTGFTLSATGAVRDVRTRMLALLALGLAASALVAVPLVGWILRPVKDLDAAAHEIAQGHLDARVSPAVGPTELRGLASSFNSMAGSVSAALEQQRGFVGNASHQLRNPLTTLRLRVENLQAHIDQEGHTDRHEALSETERLSEIVDSLLRLARAEASKAEGGPTDIYACVRDRAREWQPLLPDLILDLDGAEGETVLARRDVVEEILNILLDNAAKFAAGGRVWLTVSQSSSDAQARRTFVTLSYQSSGFARILAPRRAGHGCRVFVPRW